MVFPSNLRVNTELISLTYLEIVVNDTIGLFAGVFYRCTIRTVGHLYQCTVFA